VCAHHHVVPATIVATLDLRDLATCRERPGGANGVHHRLSTRVCEANLFEGRHAFTQQPGQPHLRDRDPGEGGSLLQLALDRIENTRMLVSEDQRRVVAGEIEELVAVKIG
jgi:hypothetical protein